ncbi:MAG: hypothetical protein U0790_07220 [Isosphaeraceae bacterium]
MIRVRQPSRKATATAAVAATTLRTVVSILTYCNGENRNAGGDGRPSPISSPASGVPVVQLHRDERQGRTKVANRIRARPAAAEIAANQECLQAFTGFMAALVVAGEIERVDGVELGAASGSEYAGRAGRVHPAAG